MKYSRQITSGVDVSGLHAGLLAQPYLWNKNPCRLSVKGPHRETQDIFLRYKDERPHIDSGDWSQFSAPHVPEWYASIDHLPTAKPTIFRLMATAGAEMLGGVFIYKVEPGSQIYPHRDVGWHPDYFDKFNVCIQSNPSAAFRYEGEQFVQQAGDIHQFRNDVLHNVVNEGDCDHIVMTVCMRIDRGNRVPWSPEGWSLDEQQIAHHQGER